jgi:transposase
MSQFRLKPGQRRRLRRLLDETFDLNTYRRCLALLEVDAGRPVADVARSLGVARQSIHNWISRFDGSGRSEALADRYGGGHPMALDVQEVEGLVALLGHSPQHFGSPAANWTVPLLREHLRRATGAEVSEPTMRRQLRRLGYVWKRPRYVLDPDPELEKKTADPPPPPATAVPKRHPRRGRDRPAALPAAPGRLGAGG